MAWDDDLDQLRVMTPIEITDANITATDVTPGDPNPAWSSGSTYAVGDRVYKDHKVYESLKASNTNKDPVALINQFDATGAATWWLEVGPTNLWAMFDGLASTQTARANSVSVTLRPGAFNGFALFGIEGDQAVITIKDAPGGTVIYSYDNELEGSMPPDYFEYFFDGFRPLTRIIQTGLAPYASAEITVTITRVTGDAKIGLLALGDLRPLGVPLRGASVEPQDFSYIYTNEYGITKTKKRYNSTGMVIATKMDIEDATLALDTVRDLLGTPCVVVGSEKPGYEGLTVFGLLSGRMGYDEFGMTTLNLTVKGLV